MKNFTEKFYCLLKFIGWGDPNGGYGWLELRKLANDVLIRWKKKDEFIKMCRERANKKYNLNYVKQYIKKIL